MAGRGSALRRHLVRVGAFVFGVPVDAGSAGQETGVSKCWDGGLGLRRMEGHTSAYPLSEQCEFWFVNPEEQQAETRRSFADRGTDRDVEMEMPDPEPVHADEAGRPAPGRWITGVALAAQDLLRQGVVGCRAWWSERANGVRAMRTTPAEAKPCAQHHRVLRTRTAHRGGRVVAGRQARGMYRVSVGRGLGLASGIESNRDAPRRFEIPTVRFTPNFSLWHERGSAEAGATRRRYVLSGRHMGRMVDVRNKLLF